MIINVEGPDGSGKSTLLNIIGEMLDQANYPVEKHGENNIPTHPFRPNRLTEDELYKQLNKMIKSNTVYLVDRGVISDILYRVFDDYKSITQSDKYLKFVKENGNKILIIYCRSNIAEQKMLERGDENPVAIKNHKELTKIYDLFMPLVKLINPLSVIQYDMAAKKGNKSINEVLGRVNQFVYLTSNKTNNLKRRIG